MAEEDASKEANTAQAAVAPTQNNAQKETSVAPVVTAPTQSDTSSIASSAQSASNNAAVPVSAPQNFNDALSSSTSTTVTAKNAFGKIISAQNTAARIKPEHPAAKSVSVDVDLTALSSTMVYSEVLNIMTAPETYIGKTLKMNGIFSYYYDENTNKYYFGCIIQDALEVLGDSVKEEEFVEGMQAEEEHHHEGEEADEHHHDEGEEDDDEDEDGHHHHDEEEAEYDEHVWLSLAGKLDNKDTGLNRKHTNNG